MVFWSSIYKCKSVCTVLLFLIWKPEFRLKTFWLEVWLQETRKARKRTHTLKSKLVLLPHHTVISSWWWRCWWWRSWKILKFWDDLFKILIFFLNEQLCSLKTNGFKLLLKKNTKPNEIKSNKLWFPSTTHSQMSHGIHLHLFTCLSWRFSKCSLSCWWFCSNSCQKIKYEMQPKNKT